MTTILTPSALTPLAWTLCHFVWQGAALGLAAFVWLRRRRESPTARYLIGVATLSAMLAAPILTFTYLIVSAPAVPAAGQASTPTTLMPATVRTAAAVNAGPTAAAILTPAVVVLVWVCGVSVLSVRLIGGWVVARRFVRRGVRPVSPEVRSLGQRIAGRLALDRIVTIVESSSAVVPMIAGWLSPVILLPAATLTGLSPTQLEALLAHELAHVRRHDYLVNLLQNVAETLLFYHPAVWWVSRQVRTEREYCCDDLAIATCGDRLVYATALSELAALAAPRPLALAATDGSLLDRVRRILGQAGPATNAQGAWMSLVLVCLLVTALVPAVAARRGGPLGTFETPPATARGAVPSSWTPQAVNEGKPGAPANYSAPAAAGWTTKPGSVDQIAVETPPAANQKLPTESLELLEKQIQQLERQRQEILEKLALQESLQDQLSAYRDRYLDELKIKLRGAQGEPALAQARLKERLRALEEQQAAEHRRAEELERQHAVIAEGERLRLEERSEQVKRQLEERSEQAGRELAGRSDGAKLQIAEIAALTDEAKKILAARPLEARGQLSLARPGGGGIVVPSAGGQTIQVRWTGSFRLSEDNRNVVWIEPGRMVTIGDGSSLVEIKGLADGSIAPSYTKAGQPAPYDPAGRAFVSAILQKVLPFGIRFDAGMPRENQPK